MTKTYLAYFILIFFIFSFAFAQDNSPVGARSSGIGNASVSLADLWSAQNNQAGLGFLKNSAAGVYYQNQFMLKELNTKAFAFAMPAKHGTFGLCVSNFGYSLFSKNKYGIAFGKAFGENISAGVMMGYMETNISEYGKKGSLVAEAGIQVKPMKHLTFGMHLFNPTKTKLAKYDEEYIPAIFRLGVDYKFSDRVLIACETEKDIDNKAMFKAGLEYKPVKELYLRAGISTHPSLSCFGFGMNLKRFKFDLSSTYHSTLGFSPQIGLTYQFDAIAKNESHQISN